MTSSAFTCSSCGEVHDGLAFGYSAPAPVYWSEEVAENRGSFLSEEQCVINGEHQFVRGRIVLPVRDADEDFEWGVWVSLSPANFARMIAVYEDPARENEPPYFGWLSTNLPGYEPTTVNLKTNLHTQALGVRPLVEVEPTDHPLAVEQREGITLARVREIAEIALHG
ncbi:hypothetical protein SAMN05216553_112205 [Lentzea fradiae]|uniref:DUF2199 domain-containing protein n=1 Tax=Lentzea fradiae TaxID=200378 RepID=A0A1G7XSP8_9PSEU|nr:DUF2199 domain-containing protein [Lentzea fradiae]SDG87239.1 hypothetical protein SAMN05216553_112205 [Lentzea fradiae]